MLLTTQRNPLQPGYNRKKQGFEWKVTVDDFVETYEKQDGRCALSGVVLTHYRDGGGAKIIQLLHRQNQPPTGIHKEEHPDRDVHSEHDEGHDGRIRVHTVGEQHLQVKVKGEQIDKPSKKS